MGRGNACVHGKYEGLYYIDYDYFNEEFEDNWECSKEIFIEDIMKRFKSFTPCKEWLEHDQYAILENGLFYIAVEDNEWSIAIKLLQKDNYYIDNIGNLQSNHYLKYLDGIKECLFNQFDTLGVYGGPWTSGRITKKEELKSCQI